jgi:hypothetical protein
MVILFADTVRTRKKSLTITHHWSIITERYQNMCLVLKPSCESSSLVCHCMFASQRVRLSGVAGDLPPVLEGLLVPQPRAAPVVAQVRAALDGAELNLQAWRSWNRKTFHRFLRFFLTTAPCLMLEPSMTNVVAVLPIWPKQNEKKIR